MGIKSGTILSLAGALLKNNTGHPLKKAVVGTMKAPVTAPLAVAKAMKEKPFQSGTMVAGGALASSYIQTTQDINLYEYSSSWYDVVASLATNLFG